MALIEIAEFAPPQSGSHGAFHFDPPASLQRAGSLGQRRLCDRPQIVAIDNARRLQTFGRPEANLGGDIPDGSK
jgi:hypothetical protein